MENKAFAGADKRNSTVEYLEYRACLAWQWSSAARMMRFGHPNRLNQLNRKDLYIIHHEFFENKKMSIMVSSVYLSKDIWRPVVDGYYGAETFINMADNFAWLTDRVEKKLGTSAYRDNDRFVIVQPNGRVIGRHYHVTDFKKTIICKLIGCNSHRFPGDCHNGTDSWFIGVFCTRCGNARYWSKLPPRPNRHRNDKPMATPLQGPGALVSC